MILEVGDETFDHEVVERSAHTPVVVDLWAAWCQPCRALTPILERLAAEHEGEFILATVDVEAAPRVAQQLAVRSIPTVIGFRDGLPVAEFVGAQPERAIRQFLGTVLPTEADRAAKRGLELAGAGDNDGAEAQLRAALELDSRHPRALLDLAHLLAERDDREQALALIDRVVGHDALMAEAERLAAKLRTAANGDVDETALRARIEADADDLAARLELGRALGARRDYERALEELVAVIERDPHFEDDAARKSMLDLFAVLGTDDPLTQRFRAELARVLYR